MIFILPDATVLLTTACKRSCQLVILSPH